MRAIHIFYFAFLLIFFSCKKIDSTDVQQNSSTDSSDQITTQSPQGKDRSNLSPDSAQPSYYKYDLSSQGGGTYTGLAKDPNGTWHHVTVSDIFYRTLDDWGRPIPVRDGDPIYGTLGVDYSDGGSTVYVQPDGSKNQNHFSITFGVFNGGNGSVNLNGYQNAYDSYWTTYQNQYSGWQQNGGTQPAWNPPSITSYVSTSYGGAGFETYTGKLIRSTSGTTTFAIASENYPEPDPISPPVYNNDELAGYWMYGSTKIWVFVNKSNESQITTGTIANSTGAIHYPATGTYNGISHSVNIFSMTVNGTTYTYTGALSGAQLL